MSDSEEEEEEEEDVEEEDDEGGLSKELSSSPSELLDELELLDSEDSHTSSSSSGRVSNAVPAQLGDQRLDIVILKILKFSVYARVYILLCVYVQLFHSTYSD